MAVWMLESDLVPATATSGEGKSLLFIAIYYRRAKVVRALHSRGANLDAFVSDPDERFAFTSVGYAIFAGRVAMLRLLVKLGADLSHVWHSLDLSECWLYTKQSTPIIQIDAISYAVMNIQLACLVYLVDVVNQHRSVSQIFRGPILMWIVSISKAGQRAIPMFRILRRRHFDFKSLASHSPQTAPFFPPSVTYSSAILAAAKCSPDTKLLKFLTSKCGITTSATCLHVQEAENEWMDVFLLDRQPNSRSLVDTTKFSCVNCNKIGANHHCSGCKSRRYCSKECQVEDWKREGGHKKECKMTQRSKTINGNS